MGNGLIQWKRKRARFRANQNKPKVLRFGPDAQPHAKTCRCFACLVYIRFIAKVNPARLEKIEGKENANLLPSEDNSIPLYMLGRKSEREKQFAVERYRRENRGKSTPKWRG